MAAAVWTEQHSAKLRELNAAGLTQGEAAEQLGVSRNTVQYRSKGLGLKWDGAMRDQAGVRRAQVEEKRLGLADQLMADAGTLRDRLFAGTFKDLVKGEYGSEQAAELDFVPSKAVQSLASAINGLARAAVDLKKLDALHNGGSAADTFAAWLSGDAVLMIKGKAAGLDGRPIEGNDEAGDSGDASGSTSGVQ